METPFFIRQLIDHNEENFVAIACQNEIRLFDKAKLVRHIMELKKNAPQEHGQNPFRSQYNYSNFDSVKLGCRYQIGSIMFNPKRPRELLVLNPCEINLLTIKKEGTSATENNIVKQVECFISKAFWVAETTIAYQTSSAIYIQSTEAKWQLVFVHSNQGRFKDFCIMPYENEYLLLAFDYQGVIYQHLFSLRDTQRVALSVTLRVPEMRDAHYVPQGISLISHNLLMISFKSVCSFLCTLQENNRQFIIKAMMKLDVPLQKAKIEHTLLCGAQLVSTSKESLTIVTSMLNNKSGSFQYNFHRGQLGLFEIGQKQIKFQQLEGANDNGLQDSYTILKENSIYQIILAIVDRKLISYVITKHLNKKPHELYEDKIVNSIKQEERSNNISSGSNPLQKQMKDVLTKRALQQGVEYFKVQQDFALQSPNHTTVDLFIDGQLQNGLMNAQPQFGGNQGFETDQKTISMKILMPRTQNNGVHGIRILFGKNLMNVVICIEDAREVKKVQVSNSFFLNIPFTILETIYSMAHSEINLKISTETEGLKIQQCFVHLTEVKQLQQRSNVSRFCKALQALEYQEGHHLEEQIKNTTLFQLLDANSRATYLKQVFESPYMITLVNSLDMVSMSLLASRKSLQTHQKNFLFEMVRMLSVVIMSKFEAVSTEDKLVSVCSKRLLKILLTANRLTIDESSRIILGHELDYKTINDNLFFEFMQDNVSKADLATVQKYLKKLLLISEKRFPQIFLFFAKYPNLLRQLAQKVCQPSNEGSQLISDILNMLVRLYVIRYYFEINKGDGHVAYQVFEEMGQMIDNFSIGFQCKFQEILQNQLTKEFKYFHRREYKLNNYDYAIDVYSIQSQMEIEPPRFETPKFEQPQPPPQNQPHRQQPFQHIENFDIDFDHDLDYDEELLFRQVVENSRREAEHIQQQEQKQSAIIEEVVLAAPECAQKPPLNINYSSLPKSTHLTVKIPDVYEGFIQWVTRKISTGMSERPSQMQSSAKDDQSVILMVYTLFSSLKTYSKLRLSRPQEPNHQLYQAVWEIIINSIKSLNIQKTLGFTKNPEFPVKLVVILLIFGNKQLQQKDQPLNSYKNAMEAIFDGFPDTILGVLSRLQEAFSQKLGSVYQQQQLQAAEKQRRESFQPKREDETRQQLIQRYSQMPSHTKAVNNAPPVEIMTIKKCKNMINDLLRGEGSINESSKIFEISDQLIYVYLTKILINLGRYSDFLKNQVVQNKSQWGSFICKALLDKITKSLSTAELKSLLCDVMRKDEYYRVKDFNLYQTQLQTLDQNLPDQSTYKNQKLCYQSLKILSKIAKKRPHVWRNYFEENRDSIQYVKKALGLSQCAALALQMLETLI